MKILDQVKLMFHETTVFGEPYEKDGTTVIPASHVWGGGGGGGPAAFGDGSGAGGAGVGLDARPVGAFVIKAGEVTWFRPSTSAGSSCSAWSWPSSGS